MEVVGRKVRHPRSILQRKGLIQMLLDVDLDPQDSLAIVLNRRRAERGVHDERKITT